MEFKMDYETFIDLDIFNAGSGETSVFSKLNKTRTEGGKKKLIEFLKTPTDDKDTLIKRSSYLKFMVNQQQTIEFTYKQLDLIEHYLTFNKRYLRANYLDALWDSLKHKISPTSDYYIVSTGIREMINLLKSIQKFLNTLNVNFLPQILQKRLQDLDHLLSDNSTCRQIIEKKETSFYSINKLDVFFRKENYTSSKLILDLIYEFDMIEAIVDLVRLDGWNFPEYMNDGNLNVEIGGLFHPLIKDPICNDFRPIQDIAVTFLTGPNMGGKSTFLKAVGLAIYLAHLGFPVPARTMRTPIYNGLMTTINLPDNISEGLSHYYSEVRRIKKVATHLAEGISLFVIFDELFRGTNYNDAYLASVQIIPAFANIKRSKFIISSHSAKLGSELQKFDFIQFCFFECIMEDGTPHYTYRIKPGISEQQLGTYILKQEGIMELLNQTISIESKEI